MRKDLCFVFVLDFVLCCCFWGALKRFMPNALPFPPLLTNGHPPAALLAPRALGDNAWSVARRRAGGSEGAEHPTLTSFPAAPPAPPHSQWGKENLADSASPAGVGTPGTAARIGLLGQSKSGAGSCCQNGRDELGQEDPGRGRKHGGRGQSGVLQDGAWAPRGPSRQGRSGCHHPEGPGSEQPSDGAGAPGTGSWVGGLRTTALQAAALQ